jgi:hypothetical protein
MSAQGVALGLRSHMNCRSPSKGEGRAPSIVGPHLGRREGGRGMCAMQPWPCATRFALSGRRAHWTTAIPGRCPGLDSGRLTGGTRGTRPVGRGAGAGSRGDFVTDSRHTVRGRVAGAVKREEGAAGRALLCAEPARHAHGRRCPGCRNGCATHRGIASLRGPRCEGPTSRPRGTRDIVRPAPATPRLPHLHLIVLGELNVARLARFDGHGPVRERSEKSGTWSVGHAPGCGIMCLSASRPPIPRRCEAHAGRA